MARRRRIVAAPDPAGPSPVSPAPFIGMGLVVTSFFLYAASSVAVDVPWLGLVLLVLLWLVQFVLCLRWWTPHPDRLPWVGGGSFVVWFVAILAGARFLGWG